MLRDAAGEQARGLDQLGRDDPAPGLLDQRRAGMDEELDAARAEVVLIFFVLQADMAEQAGEQRLVDGFVARGQLVFLPAMLVAERHQLAMHVAPLAQAQPVDEVLPAPLALLVGRLVLPDLVGGVPQLEIGKELGLLVLPLGVGLVGGRRLLLRPLARVLRSRARRR